jgi:cyclopropane fatty-acyl-phospholipid synthase-like methyltransferase
MKSYSESSEENKFPILEVLRTELTDAHTILEIGSGTGQHAVFFAAQLPHLLWQPSDVLEQHGSINAWIADAGLNNVLPPLELDVTKHHWPAQQYDAVFSANTTHIMSWPEVVEMFRGIGAVIRKGGKFCLYGPFNYGGKYTSQSNAHFDEWLKARDPKSGIRNFEALDEIAGQHHLKLIHDYEMPVNNRLLVWRKV